MDMDGLHLDMGGIYLDMGGIHMDSLNTGHHTMSEDPYLGLKGLRNDILNCSVLYSVPVEISRPLFILLNIYKGAFVSSHMSFAMNALLLSAAGFSLLLELPVKGDAFTLYFICMVCVTYAGLELQRRALTFVALTILISLSQPMGFIVDCCFCVCFLTKYSEAPDHVRSEVKAVICFCLFLSHASSVYAYVDIYGPDRVVWAVEILHAILMVLYIFGARFDIRDQSLPLRFHIGFFAYFQASMLMFQHPKMKDGQFTYALKLFLNEQ